MGCGNTGICILANKSVDKTNDERLVFSILFDLFDCT